MGEQQGPTMSREEIEKQIRERAAQDDHFREQLLANPKAVLKDAFKVDLPPDVEFLVVQETPSRFYLVLPVRSAELTDEELAHVAGGWSLLPILAPVFPKLPSPFEKV